MAKRNKPEIADTRLVLDTGALRSTVATVLATISGTIVGTSALVGIHHSYRKQSQPDARLNDYVTGIRRHRPSLKTLSIPARLHCHYQSKIIASKTYVKSILHGEYGDDDNLLASHTTIMLTRPVCWVSGVSSMPRPMSHSTNNKSAAQDSTSRSNHSNNSNHSLERCCGVVGIDADRHLVWQTTMPERVHDIVVQPNINNDSVSDPVEISTRDVVVMGRRPSASFWVLDTNTGQVKQAIKANADRHFYGHACYSLDGSQLYVTENDTVSLEGRIGIYDAFNGYRKVAEFASCGIGPHELIMHPDGETLIIANGGIKTEQASREELNLDTMRPSLVYLNRHDGELLEQIIPEHNQMSIRHLAIHDNGMVMIGIQFQGEKHLNVPLVLTHQRGDAKLLPMIMPNGQWQRFHQYIASVAVDSQNNLLCVTTPIGGCAAIYDLASRELINDVKLLDCAGASVISSNDKTCANDNLYTQDISADLKDNSAGFIVSDGQGQLTALYINSPSSISTSTINRHIIRNSTRHNMSFDNHLQRL